MRYIVLLPQQNETEELKMLKNYRSLSKGDIFIFNSVKAIVTGTTLKNGKMIISTTCGVAVKEPFEQVQIYNV